MVKRQLLLDESVNSDHPIVSRILSANATIVAPELINPAQVTEVLAHMQLAWEYYFAKHLAKVVKERSGFTGN